MVCRARVGGGDKHDTRWVLTVIEQDLCWVHVWVNTYIKEWVWDTVGLLEWLSSHMCKHKLIKPCTEHILGWNNDMWKVQFGLFLCVRVAGVSLLGDISVCPPPPLPHPPNQPLLHRPRLHTSVQQIQRAGTLLFKHLLKAGWKSQQHLQQPVSVSSPPPSAQLQSQTVQPHKKKKTS